MGSDWEATEERLVARSDERRSRLARRDRRRSVVPWLLAPLVFPALGAAAALVLVENAGGDFADWTASEAAAALIAVFLVPAVLSAWVARRQGALEAIAWAFVCVGVQLALVVGVGFLALGLGPE
jgi:cytochrome bd-type quinol oxidase subunit 2